MNGPGHFALVDLAFQGLRGQAANRWHPLKKVARETCMLPDAYSGPLLRGENGDWRRYISPQRPLSNFEIMQRRGRPIARHFFPDNRFHSRNVIQHLQSPYPSTGRSQPILRWVARFI